MGVYWCPLEQTWYLSAYHLPFPHPPKHPAFIFGWTNWVFDSKITKVFAWMQQITLKQHTHNNNILTLQSKQNLNQVQESLYSFYFISLHLMTDLLRFQNLWKLTPEILCWSSKRSLTSSSFTSRCCTSISLPLPEPLSALNEAEKI